MTGWGVPLGQRAATVKLVLRGAARIERLKEVLIARSQAAMGDQGTP